MSDTTTPPQPTPVTPVPKPTFFQTVEADAKIVEAKGSIVVSWIKAHAQLCFYFALFVVGFIIGKIL